MFKVRARFIGRKKGALGKTYEIVAVREVLAGMSFNEFILSLYDEYECITLDERDVFEADSNTRYFYDNKRRII